MAKLILIDGNALIHRAFHSTPPFKTSKGEIVNAIYGFTSMLLTVIQKQKPEYLALTFDLRGKTLRHDDYAEYKATRTKAPDELYAQIPRIKDLVRAFSIPIYEVQGYEADDLLGTLSVQVFEQTEHETFIVTGDKDTLQLINERVKVITPDKGFAQPFIYDTQAVITRYGITPSQIIDLKALQGDSSDNIKGVAGIGPKTAQGLLQEYQNLNNIYQNLDKIKLTDLRRLLDNPISICL